MALQINKDSNYGVTATYWKISRMNIDWFSNYSQVAIGGWADKTARDNQSFPLKEFVYEFNGPDFPLIESEPQNEREIFYNLIKQNEDFNGATDI